MHSRMRDVICGREPHIYDEMRSIRTRVLPLMLGITANEAISVLEELV